MIETMPIFIIPKRTEMTLKKLKQKGNIYLRFKNSLTINFEVWKIL